MSSLSLSPSLWCSIAFFCLFANFLCFLRTYSYCETSFPSITANDLPTATPVIVFRLNAWIRVGNFLFLWSPCPSCPSSLLPHVCTFLLWSIAKAREFYSNFPITQSSNDILSTRSLCGALKEPNSPSLHTKICPSWERAAENPPAITFLILRPSRYYILTGVEILVYTELTWQPSPSWCLSFKPAP